MAREKQLLWAMARVLAIVLLIVAPAAASAQDATIKEFFGTFIGNALIKGDNEFRDIIVAIEPARNGFSIYTSTVIRKGPLRAVPNVRWRSETQRFVQSDKPHLFEPLIRESTFTRRREPDLFGGDSVAWASIRGNTLGVYAADVLEDGHYELRVFERTLTDLGLDLRFTRYRDGVIVRQLEGILARADDD